MKSLQFSVTAHRQKILHRLLSLATVALTIACLQLPAHATPLHHHQTVKEEAGPSPHQEGMHVTKTPWEFAIATNWDDNEPVWEQVSHNESQTGPENRPAMHAKDSVGQW